MPGYNLRSRACHGKARGALRSCCCLTLLRPICASLCSVYGLRAIPYSRATSACLVLPRATATCRHCPASLKLFVGNIAYTTKEGVFRDRFGMLIA